MIVIDLSKQKILDADPKAIQQINITGHLARNPVAYATMVFIIEKTPFYISHNELWAYCELILFSYNISIKWLNIPL